MIASNRTYLLAAAVGLTLVTVSGASSTGLPNPAPRSVCTPALPQGIETAGPLAASQRVPPKEKAILAIGLSLLAAPVALGGAFSR